VEFERRVAFARRHPFVGHAFITVYNLQSQNLTILWPLDEINRTFHSFQTLLEPGRAWYLLSSRWRNTFREKYF